MLEDGTRFDGAGTGRPGSRTGEVVFTTGMVGYPESLTDPSYRGQILVFTYPLLGNYGVPDPAARDPYGLPRFLESDEIQVRGAAFRGMPAPSHWNSSRTLPRWMDDGGIPGIVGIDTRRLTEHLRTNGVVRGILEVREGDSSRPASEELSEKLRRAPRYEEERFVEEVSVSEPVLIRSDVGPLIAVPDCGVKASILRALLKRKLSILRLPHDHEIPERWDGRPIGGLLVGNGPGDPAQLGAAVAALRAARSRNLPTLGICLGNQLLALSRGATTFKMKYGHRGQNKTVCFTDGRALIASENHGYAVEPASLAATGLRPWAVNPDDGTIEGLRDARGRTIALQGHPEGHPGPQETGFVFDLFAGKVRRSVA